MSATAPPKRGTARCPTLSVQEIIERDGDRPEGTLTEESYRFLGDDDIPVERYTSRQFYGLEMERMWPRVWQWACREEHIPETGDYYVYDIGRYSVLLVRAPSGIKGYVNSCLHRGTKLKPSGSEGFAQALRCPFHGWTWSLEGELVTIPCAWDFPHVDRDRFSLPQVRVETWGGFVFINMDPFAPPLLEYLEVLPEHASRSGLESRTVAIHVEKELNCNWKVASEAFVEAYHVQETHPQIMISNGDEASQYDFFGPHVNRIISPNGVTSPHLKKSVSEQERADSMLAGDTKSAAPVVAPNSSARATMAQHFRDALGISDRSSTSTTELIDTHGYLVFPTGHFFLGRTFPIAYRIRPLDDGPDRSLFELLVLRASTKGNEPPATPVRLKVGESYSTVPGISSSFAAIMDQDTSITGWQQEGFKTSSKKTITLASYQEIRIRHAHRTLDAYLATPPDRPVSFTSP